MPVLQNVEVTEVVEHRSWYGFILLFYFQLTINRDILQSTETRGFCMGNIRSIFLRTGYPEFNFLLGVAN